MKVGAAIAEIMKREGVENLFGYPFNYLIDYAAEKDIRPIIVRQERHGLHMADAMSRLTSGDKIGAFCMQHGPGSENAYGGVAQAYSESIPVLVIPAGYNRREAQVGANFSSAREMRGISKMAESLTTANDVANVMRRAFSRLKNGRGAPCVVEIPLDLWNEEMTVELEYEPVSSAKYAASLEDIRKAADVLVNAKRPVIYAGQGVHWSKAWDELLAFAEYMSIPVTTSLEGKSAFPEDHELSLGTGGQAISRTVRHFLDNADVIFGVGCSFTETQFGTAMPKGKTFVHLTLDPDHLNKDIPAKVGLIGDAKPTLTALLEEVKKQVSAPRDSKDVASEIAVIHEGWLKEWMPKLTSDEAPFSPYRVLWDLQQTVDVENTIITHDAGSPRDQLAPYWITKKPLTYIGWGKSTQLGYGLGLAMGAKMAHPDKLCINVWGDSAIGFTGMDFETAVRERIPILSILLNNFSMAIEVPHMPISTEKYRSTDISGDYAMFARSLGGYGERITDPAEIIPAIKRGIQKTQEGVPVLLEFITKKETEISRHPPSV